MSAEVHLVQGLPDSPLMRVFRDEGEPVLAGANAPFLLENPHSVWMVLRGHVNVFAVKVVEGAPVGARHYLFTVEAGDLVPGIEPGWGDEIGLLAIGVVGSEVLRLPIQALYERRSEVAGEVRGGIDRYCLAFSSAVSAREQPQADLLLVPGDEPAVVEGMRISARRNVAWIRVQTGELRFAAIESLTVRGENGPFPVSEGAWLVATEQTSIRVLTDEELIGNGVRWTGVRAFQRIILEWTAQMLEDERRREQERLINRLYVNRRVSRRALESLAGVAGGEEAVDVGPGSTRMLAACRMIGRELGVEFRPASAWERGRGKATDELRAIARSSGVGYRRVVLAPGWWTRDNGPLLGFFRQASEGMTFEEYQGAELEPVAILPVDASSYEVHDPVTGERRPVDAEKASAMEPFGYELYRSLPARVLDAKDIWRFVTFRSWKDVRTLLSMGALGAALGLFLPILTATVFDTIIPAADRAQMVNVFLALIVAAVASMGFQLTRQFAALRLRTRVQVALQMAVLDRLIRLPMPFFRNFTAGDLAQRAHGVTEIGRSLSGATLTSILDSVVAGSAFVLLFHYSVELALVATAILLVNVAFLGGTAYLALSYARDLEAVQGHLSGLVLELLGGISKLRVAGAEIRAFALWAKEFRTEQELGYRLGVFEQRVDVFNSVLSIASTLAVYGAYVALARDPAGGLTTGEFLAFNAAFGMFVGSMTGLTVTAVDMVALIPTWERAKPILDTIPEMDLDKPDPGELTGRIEVSHLTFRYTDDGPLILDDVSLEAEPGEFIALVGPSGAGKSTLLRILLGFDQPESSSVYYDRHDLSTIDVTAVRRQIGVVLQSSRLTAGDIFSNIVGTSSYNLGDAWEAARMAGIEADIQAMPMKLHTVVSEGGGSLSGGQRQRLLIARALVSRPRILFFDEATSALDNRAQHTVSDSIDKLHATRVVIAHRMSTIRSADRIYVMESGRIVQSGTYDDLVSVPGLFAELAAREDA